MTDPLFCALVLHAWVLGGLELQRLICGSSSGSEEEEEEDSAVSIYEVSISLLIQVV